MRYIFIWITMSWRRCAFTISWASKIEYCNSINIDKTWHLNRIRKYYWSLHIKSYFCSSVLSKFQTTADENLEAATICCDFVTFSLCFFFWTLRLLVLCCWADSAAQNQTLRLFSRLPLPTCPVLCGSDHQTSLRTNTSQSVSNVLWDFNIMMMTCKISIVTKLPT